LSEIILTVDGVDPVELYGENNAKLNLLRKAFPDVVITSRGSGIKLLGDKKETQEAKAKFEIRRATKPNCERRGNQPLSMIGDSIRFQA
jgi:phosphate starvation-inducible PhoH-like protein